MGTIVSLMSKLNSILVKISVLARARASVSSEMVNVTSAGVDVATAAEMA